MWMAVRKMFTIAAWGAAAAAFVLAALPVTSAEASVPPKGRYDCFDGPGYNFNDAGRLTIKPHKRYRFKPVSGRGQPGGGKLKSLSGKRFKVKNGVLAKSRHFYYTKGRWHREGGEVRIDLRPSLKTNPYQMGCAPPSSPDFFREIGALLSAAGDGPLDWAARQKR